MSSSMSNAMSSGGLDEFDLHAAWMRRAQGDTSAFMEALAARLAEALPGRVHVIRKKDGLFAKTSHVAQIALDTGNTLYTLDQDATGLHAGRSRSARGVILKRETMPVPAWLTALAADLQVLSAEIEGAHAVLRNFLLS
jgi:hypothetical protein